MRTLTTLVSTFIAAAAVSAPVLAAQDQTKMDHDAMMEQGAQCGIVMGEGVIDALDVRKSKVTVSHKPIPAIGWPQMKMEFSILKPVDLAAFAVGENVHFLLNAEKDKSYSIAAICSLDAASGAHKACMAQMHQTAMSLAAAKGEPCDMEGMGDMEDMDHSKMDMGDGDAKKSHEGHH